jgi:putative phage-type endonuclease
MEERKNYIGASEAAQVLGKSRWGTPLSLWAEKTGAMEPKEIGDKLYVKLGVKLEQAVAELFTELTGKKVHKVNEAFVHKQHPFIRCHIDRKVEGERSILQCKTASAFKSKEWDGEEIPEEYEIQEHHELACSGYDRAYIACLIGNQKVALKVIERDAAKINYVISREVSFWKEFVEPKIMPTLGFVKSKDTETLLGLYPSGDDGLGEVALPDEADALLESLEGLKADSKLMEKSKKEIEAKIQYLLGKNVFGRSNNFLVKWSNMEQRRVDSDRMKEDAPELFEKFAKVIKMRRFDPRRIQVTEAK